MDLFVVLVALGGLIWAVVSAARAGTRLWGKYELSQVEKQRAQEVRSAINRAVGEGRTVEVQLLADYHAHVLTQSRISFWFGLVFSALGFLVILLGALFVAREQWTEAAFKVIAGVVIDAVSVLFITQAGKARDTMREFFADLRVDIEMQRRISAAKEILDPTKRDEVLSELALGHVQPRVP